MDCARKPVVGGRLQSDYGATGGSGLRNAVGGRAGHEPELAPGFRQRPAPVAAGEIGKGYLKARFQRSRNFSGSLFVWCWGGVPKPMLLLGFQVARTGFSGSPPACRLGCTACFLKQHRFQRYAVVKRFAGKQAAVDFQQRNNSLPRIIAIQRYDLETGKPVYTEIHKSKESASWIEN